MGDESYCNASNDSAQDFIPIQKSTKRWAFYLQLRCPKNVGKYAMLYACWLLGTAASRATNFQSPICGYLRKTWPNECINSWTWHLMVIGFPVLYFTTCAVSILFPRLTKWPKWPPHPNLRTAAVDCNAHPGEIISSIRDLCFVFNTSNERKQHGDTNDILGLVWLF